ncbi:MAG: DUF5615 family PIN-like protein [Bacteroidota bacterium]
MKLILDAQLPVKLSEILDQLGFSSIHVENLPRGDETSDNEIIAYADANEMFVVTKDIDFYHSFMTNGRPRKLFLITTGNIKNKQLFNLFRNNFMLINKTLKRSRFVEMNNAGIVEHNY